VSVTATFGSSEIVVPVVPLYVVPTEELTPLPNVNVASVKLLPRVTVEPLIVIEELDNLEFGIDPDNIVLVIVPTSFDDMIVPDVVGNVITLPLVVVIVDTFTVVAVIVPFAVIDPLLTIELLVIVPNTVTLENTFDISGAPLA